MRRVWAWLRVSFHAAGLLTAIVDAAHAEHLIFLSTQLRPIEEAQKMRNLILKDFAREVDYTTEQPQQYDTRYEAFQPGYVDRSTESKSVAEPRYQRSTCSCYRTFYQIAWPFRFASTLPLL